MFSSPPRKHKRFFVFDFEFHIQCLEILLQNVKKPKFLIIIKAVIVVVKVVVGVVVSSNSGSSLIKEINQTFRQVVVVV